VVLLEFPSDIGHIIQLKVGGPAPRRYQNNNGKPPNKITLPRSDNGDIFGSYPFYH
ncbi:putative cytochrome b-c1 complex subunit 10-like, partial [Triplophysa rosa]